MFTPKLENEFIFDIEVHYNVYDMLFVSTHFYSNERVIQHDFSKRLEGSVMVILL